MQILMSDKFLHTNIDLGEVNFSLECFHECNSKSDVIGIWNLISFLQIQKRLPLAKVSHSSPLSNIHSYKHSWCVLSFRNVCGELLEVSTIFPYKQYSLAVAKGRYMKNSSESWLLMSMSATDMRYLWCWCKSAMKIMSTLRNDSDSQWF